LHSRHINATALKNIKIFTLVVLTYDSHNAHGGKEGSGYAKIVSTPSQRSLGFSGRRFHTIIG
jgi:hypothetical protein